MTKKCLLASVLALIVAAGVFAQTDFAAMAKNTITVDLGPTIVAGIIGGAGNITAEGEEAVSSSGFGIGAQYELQLLKQLSVAERFAYLGGGLGISDLSVTYSGEFIGENDQGQKEKLSASFTAKRDYFKLGAKLGWRISFGKNGGFTFEPALGWYGGIGVGDTLVQRLLSGIAKKENIEDMDTSDAEEMYRVLENFIFIGGPRFTLAFGWRF